MGRHIGKYLPKWPLPYLYRAWIASIRCRHVFREDAEKVFPCICTLWHDELFPAVVLPQKYTFMMLVSANRDGQFLGSIVEAYGAVLVSGSSTHGGESALIKIENGIKDKGYGCGLTVDGPRGPRHKSKKGAIWISVRTGRPIVPIRTFFKQKITFNSWDRFQLPLPFSKITIVYGEPWLPKADLSSRESIDQACRELDRRMEMIEEPKNG